MTSNLLLLIDRQNYSWYFPGSEASTHLSHCNRSIFRYPKDSRYKDRAYYMGWGMALPVPGRFAPDLVVLKRR